MEIVFKQTPNISSRNGKSVKIIVLHSTGGQFEGAVSWLTNKKSKVSAHYVIARDGRIVQLAQCNVSTWHAGESYWRGYSQVNPISIGIELEHFDFSQDWPEKQIESLLYVLEILTEKFNIPAENIIGHKHVAAGRKVDPDTNFPWEKVRKHITEYKEKK